MTDNHGINIWDGGGSLVFDTTSPVYKSSGISDIRVTAPGSMDITAYTNQGITIIARAYGRAGTSDGYYIPVITQTSTTLSWDRAGTHPVYAELDGYINLIFV